MPAGLDRIFHELHGFKKDDPARAPFSEQCHDLHVPSHAEEIVPTFFS
jgi:hypothetical protein